MAPGRRSSSRRSWGARRPQFLPLHGYFDDLASSWHSLADEVAERMRALGEWPDAQKDALLRSQVPALASGPIDSLAAADELARRRSRVIEVVGKRLVNVGEEDTPSHDLLVRAATELEKQRWILSSH